MKTKEGKELSKDLHKRIENIESKLKDVEQEAAQSVQEYFNKFKEKIKTLIENIAQYSDRLELELAIIAEKAEITEECVRLRSHLKFFINSLETDDEPGKKVKFSLPGDESGSKHHFFKNCFNFYNAQYCFYSRRD
ncbi:MAG: DUF1732 domain-containing protein [Ignavibacteriales bacterium]|nr:DUF1732 domain-containing protein [Ignavibacteriales bacterium]